MVSCPPYATNKYTLDGLGNTDTALKPIRPLIRRPGVFSQDAIQKVQGAERNLLALYGYSANQVKIVSNSGGLRNRRCKPCRSLAVSGTAHRAQDPADCSLQIRYLPFALATLPIPEAN